MASVAELNAGFDAAISSLNRLVSIIPDKHVPFVGNLREVALEKLQSPEGRAVILDEVKQILAAAEKART